jgi:DNA-binding XRE family transcriptional regulator
MSPQRRAYAKAFGARITVRRRELGLTQTEMAAALDIAQQTYAHYEVGRYHMPIALLPALSKVLQMDVDSLLGIDSTWYRCEKSVVHTQRSARSKGRLRS